MTPNRIKKIFDKELPFDFTEKQKKAKFRFVYRDFVCAYCRACLDTCSSNSYKDIAKPLKSYISPISIGKILDDSDKVLKENPECLRIYNLCKKKDKRIAV